MPSNGQGETVKAVREEVIKRLMAPKKYTQDRKPEPTKDDPPRIT
jgi:hypothetical protein